MFMNQHKSTHEFVHFYALDTSEHHDACQGIKPKHKGYLCGSCGSRTNGRVVCDLKREDGSMVSWCLCSCERHEPAIISESPSAEVIMNLPQMQEFRASEKWPPELAKLYEEGARSFSAQAYTATSMVCRKLLMSCACHESAPEGKAFVDYVEYITGTVLTFPRAKASIDRIRTIGNEANHTVQFVNREDARKAMEIVTYMLDTIYSLPSG